jgi:hypothetical protein
VSEPGGEPPKGKGLRLDETPQQFGLLSQEEFALLTTEEKMSYLARAILSLGKDLPLQARDIDNS